MGTGRSLGGPPVRQHGPQARLTEGVLTLELPGTPATRVEELVTHTALQVRIHPAGCVGRGCLVDVALLV